MKMPTQLEPYDTTFSPQKAFLLAYASKLAYEDASTIEKACEDFGFTKCKFFSNEETSTEGYVASTSKFIVVAFRGTQEITDWWTDAQFIHTDGPLGNSHYGFTKAYRSKKQFRLRVCMQTKMKD